MPPANLALPYLAGFCPPFAPLPSAAPSAGLRPSAPLPVQVRHLPVAGRLSNDVASADAPAVQPGSIRGLGPGDHLRRSSSGPPGRPHGGRWRVPRHWHRHKQPPPMDSAAGPGSSNGVGASSRADRGQRQQGCPRLYLSEQLCMSQAIVTLSARPDGLFPLPGKESNNTRAGGVKACSAAEHCYTSRRAFIPKACGGNGAASAERWTTADRRRQSG